MSCTSSSENLPGAVAITGMACRFPGESNTPGQYWDMLSRGVDTIREIPPDRWSIDAYYHPDPDTPGRSYSKWGAFLDDIRGFDAEAFGISPREAIAIDPQHRLLLECAHEAIEDSGIPFEQLRGTACGVYMGICYSDYAHIQTRGSSLRQLGQYTGTGSVLSLASNRISYVFDLRGPSLSIDTACSSSLIALHEACNSLACGEIQHALVGGVNLLLTPQLFVTFCRLHMLSAVGRCQSFDAAADGFVRGEGAGVVMLKPLTQALADGDPVHAVIAACGANEDGRTNGITIPRLEAQMDLLKETYAAAGIRPDEVDYVEAHGTGTPVGDPIEANAIGAVLGRERPPGRPLLMGSVKSNIGHLEGGAGIAGLIKAVLVLEHGRVPPNLHFRNPSEHIDFDRLRLTVPTREEALEPDQPGELLVAGVNSFGFGGANAHAVLTSAPVPVPAPPSPPRRESGDHSGAITVSSSSRPAPGARSRCFLPLSARSEESLPNRAASMAAFLRQLPKDTALSEVSHTAARHRSHFDHRLLVSGTDREELAEALEAFAAGKPAPALIAGRAPGGDRPRLAFICSGQGPQWWGMGQELLESEPVFRAEIEACDETVRQLGDWSLVEEMSRDEQDSRINEPAIAQPAIFALQVGLAALLKSSGIEPEAVIGHSVGEIAAACITGAITREDAVRVIWWRGHTIGAAPDQGRMLAAALDENEARARLASLGGGVVVAAVNAPGSVTLSGDAAALETLAAQLEREEVFSRFLQVDYAFHSSDMDGVREPLLAALHDLPASAEPRIPLLSTVTGRPVAAGELDAAYWWSNVREPVRFADAVQALLEREGTAFLELAPHPVLSGFVRECAKTTGVASEARTVATLRRNEPEEARLHQAIGELYLAGVAPDWDVLNGTGKNAHRRISLPPYPWHRRVFWNDTAEAQSSWRESPCHPLLGRRDPSGQDSWGNHLDFSVYPWLNDHRTRGRSLFPATGYLEIALAVAREWYGDEGGAVLEEMTFDKALFLSPEGTAAELRAVADRTTGRIRMLARPSGSGEPWILYASGIVSSEKPRPPGKNGSCPGDGPGRLDLDAIRARCPDRIDGAQVYDEFLQAGFEYGESFRPIGDRWLGDQEALCRVPAGWEAHEEAPGYAFHPPAFDATLQLFGGTMPLSFHLSRSGVFVPVRIGRLRFYARPRGELWMHSVARHVTERSIDGDVRVYDAGGRLCIELLDVTSAEAFRSSENVDDWLYTTRWDRKPFAPDPRDRRRRLAAAVSNALEKAARAGAGTGAGPDSDPVAALCRQHDGEADAAFIRKHPGRLPEVLLLRALENDRDDLPGIWNHFLTDAPALQCANASIAAAVDVLVTTARDGESPAVLEFGDPLGGPTEEILARCGPGLKRYGFVSADASEGGQPGSERAFRRDPRVETLTGDDAIAEFSPNLVLLTSLRDRAPWAPARLETLRKELAPGSIVLALVIESPDSWLGQLKLIPIPDSRDLLEAAGFAMLDESPADPASGIMLLAAQVPGEMAGEPSTPPSCFEGHWLILGDRGGLGATLAGRLEAGGGHCRLHDPAADRSIDFASLLIPGDGNVTWSGIIHCLALDATPVEDTTAATLAEDEAHLCHQTLDLVQTLHLLDLPETPPLFLITAGAQEVAVAGNEDDVISLTQSPLLGLGMVIGSEMPQLRCRLIDLPAVPAGEDIERLVEEIAADTTEEEIAIRNGERYEPIITPQPLDKMPRNPGPLGKGTALRLPVPASAQFEHLCFEETDLPRPAPDEVVIAVRAAALNFRDALKVLGLYPTDNEDCFALGDECAGVVTTVGDAVTKFAPGDEVIAVSTGGLLATHARAKAVVTIRKPAHLSFEEAVTLPNVFLAASHSLNHVAQLGKGETVLIHAAAGGVGLAAMQLAREAGARIFATASRTKQELVRLLGAEAVFDSRSLDFAEEVRRLTDGRGVDVILNSLAGEALRKSFSIMAPYGRFIEIGKMDIYQNQGLPMRPFAANVSFHAIDIARVMTERSDLAEDMFVSLEERIANGTLHPLPFRSYPARRIGEAFRHLSQARHMGKIVITMDDPLPPANQARAADLELKPDRTYLVTGGYTGLGREVARCFVDHGARHLILLSRSGARDEPARKAIDEMRTLGADIFEARGDVADLDQLQEVLREAAEERSMPPIAGVFHSAMVIEDNVLLSLDAERFHRVMLPKVAGGWNLHCATRDRPLDFFVLCSSFAGMTGNPGQANYAAANLFLDTLASYRRSQGLPGTSVAWGVLGGFGVVHEDEKLRQLYHRRGITPLEPRNILDVLRLVHERKVTRIGAIRVHWGQLAAALFHYKDRIRAKLREITDAEGFDWSTAPRAPGQLREELRSLDPAKGLQLVTDTLRSRLAAILGTAPERLDADSPLNMLGLDSLMSIELQTQLERELEVPLPESEMAENPSLAKLSQRVFLRLSAAADPA